MATKVFSLATITAFGYSPTGRHNALNPNRIVNPSWNFTKTVIIKFNSSSSWVCPTGVTSVDYLVVAGGGSGGSHFGGGGGGGGYRSGSSQVTAGNTYTVTVGAGGTSVSGNGTTRGNVGSNSVFDAITSRGGGGGGARDGNVAGGDGGSGGGGGGTTSAGGAASPAGQGYAGGAGSGELAQAAVAVVQVQQVQRAQVMQEVQAVLV